MKKIGAITFHHAENYGSVLQTYALCQFVRAIGEDVGEKPDYRVIDIMPEAQKGLYSVYKRGFSASNIVKNAVAFIHSGRLKKKKAKFADFLSERIPTTEFCDSVDDLKKNTDGIEYFISGSDQIWNVRSRDFEDYYYLNFVNGAKRISYAASFGPLRIDWDKYGREKYAGYLRAYDFISTRETGSAENVKELTGEMPEIHVDPTLLLGKDEWRRIQSAENYKDGRYILLYCLEPTKAQLETVKAISERLRLPVVVTRYNNKNDIFNTFVKKYDTGPEDFLALVDNAELVITSSFHGTAFSIIYEKRFFVLNGGGDNRIRDILLKTGLIDRSLETMRDLDKVTLEPVDFTEARSFLSKEKEKSREYLKKALDL